MGDKSQKRLTNTQYILGVIMLLLGIMLIKDVVIGYRDVDGVAKEEKVEDVELVKIQEETEYLRENDGVVYGDPFSTERLDDGEVKYVGRIIIPKIKVDDSILLGTSTRKLEQGVGILEGSDLPLGNREETSIITGHRGYLWRSMFFMKIDKLGLGDNIEIHTKERKLNYEVISVSEVAVEDLEDRLYEAENVNLALVTSNKLWEKDNRILVEARLVRE